MIEALSFRKKMGAEHPNICSTEIDI